MERNQSNLKRSLKVMRDKWGYDGREVIKSANPDYIVQKPGVILELI